MSGTQAQAGAEGDFEALLDGVLEAALKNARYLTRDPDDAADLVQEAALQAFRAFATFQPGTNFKAWFLKVQHNCFLVRLRSQRRRPQTVGVPEEETVEALYLYGKTRRPGPLHPKLGGDPAQAFLDRLDAEKVEEALLGLPEEYRTVAALYFLEEFTYEQIAAVVDRPLNTVRSRIHRSRKLLQKRLWELAP